MYVPWFKPEPLEIPLPDIGPLPDQLQIHPFGALVAIGVLVGVQVASKRARQEGLHPSIIGEMCAYVLIGGFVLGHMLDAVWYHWDVVQREPMFVLQVWNGLSSFGGFVGATVGGVIWIVVRRYPLIPFADQTSFAFPFAWLFGRLGCFVVHDHPGRVTDFPLAVADYEIRGLLPPWQVRHDLGLYEVFWCLAMIPLVLWLARKKRPRGFYLAFVPIMYAPVRFGLDFLRATDIPSQDPRIAGLTPGHFGALVLLSAGLLVALRVWKGGRFVIPREVRWTAEDEGEPDTRTVEELLEELDDPRGPTLVEEPEARSAHVSRWPGSVLVVDARGAPAPGKLAGEVEALGDAEHHVWLIGPRLVPELRAIMEAHPGASTDVAIVTETPETALAESLAMPIYLQEGDDPPYLIIERDDGGLVFGMLGDPIAG